MLDLQDDPCHGCVQWEVDCETRYSSRTGKALASCESCTQRKIACWSYGGGRPKPVPRRKRKSSSRAAQRSISGTKKEEDVSPDIRLTRPRTRSTSRASMRSQTPAPSRAPSRSSSRLRAQVSSASPIESSRPPPGPLRSSRQSSSAVSECEYCWFISKYYIVDLKTVQSSWPYTGKAKVFDGRWLPRDFRGGCCQSG
jgi:hypothetical protein